MCVACTPGRKAVLNQGLDIGSSFAWDSRGHFPHAQKSMPASDGHEGFRCSRSSR